MDASADRRRIVFRLDRVPETPPRPQIYHAGCAGNHHKSVGLTARLHDLFMLLIDARTDDRSRRNSVLNKFGPSGHGEAQVQFLDGDFRVISPGTYVRCAVTGVQIPLDELKYWSVDLQEAYAIPATVLQRHFPAALKAKP
jgi:hypothetical protein